MTGLLSSGPARSGCALPPEPASTQVTRPALVHPVPVTLAGGHGQPPLAARPLDASPPRRRRGPAQREERPHGRDDGRESPPPREPAR